jgi:hypothetical protein
MNRLFLVILGLSLFFGFYCPSLFAQKPDNEWMKQYQSIKVDVNGYHVVANVKNQYGLVNVSGKEIIPCKYKNVRHAGKKGVWVQLESKKKNKPSLWGMVDFKNKWIVKPKYVFVGQYSESMVVVKPSDIEAGYADESGNEVIKPIYDDAYPFLYNRAHVKHKGKWAYFTRESDRITEFEYTLITPMRHGRGFVFKDSLCGILDVNGKPIFPVNNQMIYQIGAGSKSGIPFKYYACRQNGKWNLTDFYGKEILPREYDAISTLEPYNMITVRKGSKYAVHDSLARPVTDFQYQRLMGTPSSDTTRYYFKQNGKWGLANLKGKVMIAPEYEDSSALEVYNPYFTSRRVRKRFGLLSKTGQPLTDPKYDTLVLVSEKLLAYNFANKWGLLDTNAKELTSAVYDSLSGHYKYNRIVGYQKGKCGMLNLSGQEILPMSFNKIEELYEKGYLRTETAGKVAYFDSTGSPLSGKQEQEAIAIHKSLNSDNYSLPYPINLDEMMQNVVFSDVVRETGIRDIIYTQVLLNEAGYVDLYMVFSDIHPVLSYELLRVLPFLTFKPAIEKGKPVKTWVTVPFDFRQK